MRVITNFISNSSSASFIIEVKGEDDIILKTLYENIEDFQEANYKKLLNEALSWEERKLSHPVTDNERRCIERNIKEHQEKLEDIASFEEYIKQDVQSTLDPEAKEFYSWKKQRHIRDVVLGVVRLKRWQCSKIDDGYISFSDTTLMYNGWENISPRKTFIEMLSFFVFMKFDVRTRIESDLG